MLLAAAPAAVQEPRAALEFAVVTQVGSAAKGLSFEELRALFLFRTTFWTSREQAIVLLPAAGLPARSFLRERIYRMSETELRRFILEKVFDGVIDLPPRVVASDREAVQLATSTRGILAIVAAGAASGEGVKILPIDGKLPGEAGYPLRQPVP